MPSKVLADLAEAFGATGAGVSGFSMEGGPALERPENASLLNQAAPAVELPGKKGHSYLVAAIPGLTSPARYFWLEAGNDRPWSEGDKAALATTAAVASRWFAARGANGHDQARTQNRLQDAALMSGRLAHAFDNVLTGILGFAELTLTQLSPESAPHQYISEVLRAAQNGVQLTQQLHQFSRCTMAGRGPTQLSLIVAEEEARLRQVLDPRVDLSVEVPDDLPPVAVDMEPLRYVLSHLLDNAHESLSGAGAIALSARQVDLDAATCPELLGNPVPGAFVEVTITDGGSGFTPDAKRRLFQEPFFTTKPRHRGLGLAVVYRVLHAQCGGFRLEAGAKGGTVALVYLPVSAAAPPTPHPLAMRST